MAYKFQVGAATLSGSTKFEEKVELGGGLEFSSGTGSVAVGDDFFMFLDGGATGTSKLESISDLMTAVAGNGLAASSGVLAVGVDDSTVELNSDALRIKDSGVGTAKIADNAVTLAKMAGLARGKVIVGDSSGDPAALALGTSAQMLISDGSDLSYVSLSGDVTIAANGATTIGAGSVEHAMLADDIISGQAELAHADIADADDMMISDDGVIKKVGVDSLRDHFFGVVSGDATIADGGALTIGANAIQTGMVHDDVATELAGVGLAAASGVMALDLNELTAEAIASGDFLAFVDSTDNGTHKETVDDLATLFAGNGLAAASAVLSVDLSELSAAAVNVGADSIAIIDADDSNGSKKESITDLMTAVAGNGLAAASGVLSMDASELAQAAVADGDFIVIEDATDNSTKKEAVADLATLFAGNGLVAASSVMAVNTGKGLEINSDAVRVKTASSGGITKSAGSGNDELALNLNGLSAAAVDVGADSIAIIDGDDSDTTKKESIADLMTAAAGTGLTAASGVLHSRLDVAVKADTNTLAVGLNYMADMSSDGEDTLNLPASSGLAVGDIIHVKAPSDCGPARFITIARNGSQTIDGLTSLRIESPFGAVSMVYVAADTFRLI